MPITVETYGVHYKWQPPAVLHSQLWLAHSLREELVDLESVVASLPHPRFVGVPTASSELDSQPAAENDGKRAPSPSSSSEPRTSVWSTGQTAEGIKALYRRYCQEGVNGEKLYWATFNEVVARHRVAAKTVKAKQAVGLKAQLRHHEYRGEGTIAVTLQRLAGEPPRTPAILAQPDGKYRNVLYLPAPVPEDWEGQTRARQRQLGRFTARMRCGDTWIDLPVQAHRLLPPDADITNARLTLRRKADTFRALLQVTARIS